MQSAFIDIGLDKNAFLFLDDIVSDSKESDIRKLLKKGQEVIVQITKEAQGIKGPRVTTSLTIPGHSLVLMPSYDYVGISKKIENEEEKTRLKDVITSLKSEEHGYIVRTDAQGLSEKELKHEMDFLLEKWQDIQKNAKIKTAPCLLHSEDSLLLTVIRDFFDETVDRLVLNNNADFIEAKKLASVMTPQSEGKIVFKDGDIFALKGIETKIKKLLDRHIWLDNGAYLVIDTTEALTVIDVNTGKFTGDQDLNKTILNTNIMAAKEIARQLRLRAIGGIIIVDFIDMETDEDRQKVLTALSEASEGDKTKTNILGFVPLGLCQLTRKKTRLSLSASMQVVCPYCEGDGKILNLTSILNALSDELKRMVQNNIAKNAVLRLNPHVATALKRHVHELKEAFEGISIFIREDDGIHVEDYNISMVNDIQDQERLIKLI
jgi:ribonuclease G